MFWAPEEKLVEMGLGPSQPLSFMHISHYANQPSYQLGTLPCSISFSVLFATFMPFGLLHKSLLFKLDVNEVKNACLDDWKIDY